MGGGASKSATAKGYGGSKGDSGCKGSISSQSMNDHVSSKVRHIERTAPRKKIDGLGQLRLKLGDGGECVTVPYAFMTQAGYYPDALDKENQDAFCVREDVGELDNRFAFFGVFDGHGKQGQYCSRFAEVKLVEKLEQDPLFAQGDITQALHNAHEKANEEMHEQESLGNFNDMMSGTTAISCLFEQDKVYVSNVGDSRAISVLRSKRNGKEQLVACPLSIDQTPFRKDERERVKKAGGRVLTMSQLEGYQDPSIQDYGDEEDNDGDPPRVWHQTGKYPGTAFTRSLGDHVAKGLGVSAIPEILVHNLCAAEEYLLIASDGVFEFITSQGVVDILSHYNHDILAASRAIVAEAYRQWLQFEVRTDDITVIIIDIRNITKTVTSEARAKEVFKRTKSTGLIVLAEEIKRQNPDVVSVRSRDLDKEDSDGTSELSSFKLDNSFKLDKVRSPVSSSHGRSMQMRPVRRKVSNDVGCLTKFDPMELEGYVLPEYPKSKQEQEMLWSAIQDNYLFAHLPHEKIESAVMAMKEMPTKAGDVVIAQFAQGDQFYVATSGRYVVEVAVPRTTEDPITGKRIPIEGQYEPPREVMEYTCEHGIFPSFGELALMYNKPRAATVRCVEDGTLWGLERKAFHSIVSRDSAYHLIKVLRKVEAFASLTYNEVARLVDLLTEVKFKPGEYIVKQGEAGDAFYVVKQGTAEVTIDDVESAGGSKTVMRLAEYDYFGERSLLDSVPRAANVIAKDKVACLMIRKPLFEEVLGRLRNVLRQDGQRREGVAESYYKVQRLEQLRVFPGEMPFFQGQLYRCELRNPGAENRAGTGQFGSLRRIELPEDADLRATTEQVLAKELAILQIVNRPRLIVSFDHPEMDSIKYQLFRDEYVTDLKSFTHNRSLDASSAMLKFVMKTIASCLIELHQNRGILCRGVTPEAILMDINGRLQLTDFRYAKMTSGSRTFTACGTPEYMSPEQIQGTGHSFAADFWSMGVLMAELINGHTPWSECSEVELYESITNPVTVSMAVKEIALSLGESSGKLLQSLLKSDQDRRLRFEHNMDIESEPFFKHVPSKSSPFKQAAQAFFKSPKADVKELQSSSPEKLTLHEEEQKAQD